MANNSRDILRYSECRARLRLAGKIRRARGRSSAPLVATQRYIRVIRYSSASSFLSSTLSTLSLSPPFSPFLIYSSLAGESPANGQTAGMRTSSIRRLSSRPPFARILLYPLTELTGRNGVPAARARIHARTYHIRSCTHARICADRSARTAHILHMNAVPALRAQYITARDVSCNLRTIMQMRPERAHVRW